MPPKQKRNGGKGAHGTNGATGANSTAMPTFDKATLSKLTEQIGRELEKQKVKGLNAGGKRKRGEDDSGVKDDAQKNKQQKQQKQQPPKPKEKQQQKQQPKDQKEKQPQKQQSKKPTQNSEPSAKQNGQSSKKTATTAPVDKKAALLDEIKALGGDEADLDLVAGLDSDAEEGNDGGASATGDVSLDASFQSELAKFAAGLGFDQVRAEDEEEAEAEAEEEEAEDEDEAEDEEEGEEEEEEKEEEAVKPEPAVPQAEAPKPSELVDPYLPRNPRFNRLMFEPRPDWHSLALPPLPQPTTDDIGRLSATIASLKQYADTLIETDATAYKSIVSASSSHRFMSTIMTSGTMSDKVSALTLEVQEAPVHNIKTFETLVGLASKRSRGQAIAALGALVDLLGNGGLLPGDRRLRVFHAQPGLLGALEAETKRSGGGPLSWSPAQPLPGQLTKAHLMAWRYEDWLKDAFFRILQQLEVWCNDEIEYSRTRALDFVYGLLRSKPEQEANLLRLLVDKLGDRERKIASRASYLLLQLLTQHPGMKPIVISTIEQEVLGRSGQSLRAKYYAINTLNQTILSSKEPAVADTLVRVYFDMFLVLLKSGALGGVDLSKGGLGKKDGDVATEAQGKKTKGGKAKGGDKGKPAPKEKAKNEGIEKDVAEKMVSALLSGVNRAIPFATTDSATLEAHIDTLFRITHSSNFNTSIQALMLVQQVAVSKQLAVDRYFRTLYESLLDPRLVTSSKQAMYLNLLYRSLKSDVDARRVKAFVKRMLQVATLHQPPFVCGVLFMVAELETTFPDLRALLTDPELAADDGEEVYRDVLEGEDAAAHQERVDAQDDQTKTPNSNNNTRYDGRRRDPAYSHAETSCLWELLPYFHHYHPSVTAFARNVLARQPTPKPDMANHTLMHFLDKFVYRSPKAGAAGGGGGGGGGGSESVKPRGTSIMQPLAAAALAPGAAQIVVPGKAAGAGAGAGTDGGSLNSAAFWNRPVENVAAEDVFFHAYFSQIGKPQQASRASKRAAAREAKAGKNAGEPGSGDGDNDDSEDEDEIWEALKGSRPEIGADGDVDDVDMDDDDDDLSGLESLLNMSDEDDDDDEDDDMGSDAEDMDVDDEGGVQFADFSDDEETGEDAPDGLPLDGKKGRDRKKALRALPTFASADDYAEMLGAEEDEDYR